MYINNVSVSTRHNRPSYSGKTALVTYFFNDGQYFDPYQISAVSIFKSSDNFYPSSVTEANGQIKASASSLILNNFYNGNSYTSSTDFNVSNYTATGEQGIYKVSTGVYAVVLDIPQQSTFTINLSGINTTSTNGMTHGDFIDIWTIRSFEGVDLQTVINDFTVNYDRFFTTTEPLLFRVATRLSNRYIVLGSKIDLKFTNEVTLENTNIDRSILNLFKETLIINPQIEIFKENNEQNLPARVTVSSFANTSALCDITSDNTIIFNWDTEQLKSHPRLLDGTLGSMTGTYIVRAKFDILNQTFYSNNFSFIVS